MLRIGCIFIIILCSFILKGTRLPRVGERGPLFEFGQNIFPQKRGFVSCAVDHLDMHNEHISVATEFISYAPTNNMTVELNIPWMRHERDINGKRVHKGLGDIGLQIEYAIYNYQTSTFVRQCTLVGSLYFPTSDSNEMGLGSLLLLDRHAYTPFLGTTFSTITPQWYYFFSAGILLPSNHKERHFGATTLYQWGLGRTMIAGKDYYVIAILQFSGVSLCQQRFNGFNEPNSGRNTAYLGPVIRGAYKKFVAQAGFQNVIYERVKGDQNKSSMRLAAIINFGHDF